jgi:hypothetical protein
LPLKFLWFINESDVGHIPINAPYVSSTRMVTEEDKLNALRLAQTAQSNEGFVVVMKPTHVYRKFYMVQISSFVIMCLNFLLFHLNVPVFFLSRGNCKLFPVSGLIGSFEVRSYYTYDATSFS